MRPCPRRIGVRLVLKPLEGKWGDSRSVGADSSRRSDLVVGPDTAGARLDALRLTLDVQGRTLDVRRPPSPRPPLGEADVVARLSRLVANLTSCHDLPLTAVEGLSRIESASRYLLPRKRGT